MMFRLGKGKFWLIGTSMTGKLILYSSEEQVLTESSEFPWASVVLAVVCVSVSSQLDLAVMIVCLES